MAHSEGRTDIASSTLQEVAKDGECFLQASQLPLRAIGEKGLLSFMNRRARFINAECGIQKNTCKHTHNDASLYESIY